MDISEFVELMLADATEDHLKHILSHGVEIADDDMREALENEFMSQAQEILQEERKSS